MLFGRGTFAPTMVAIMDQDMDPHTYELHKFKTCLIVFEHWKENTPGQAYIMFHKSKEKQTDFIPGTRICANFHQLDNPT